MEKILKRYRFEATLLTAMLIVSLWLIFGG
ncbi:hypothetical protein SAMN05444724_0512 [Salinivibrio sp. ES.052]|nr:hypothetical protein SAMN05444724_0512 [Salinivibrio sp. ES.052]